MAVVAGLSCHKTAQIVSVECRFLIIFFFLSGAGRATKTRGISESWKPQSFTTLNPVDLVPSA